MVENGYVSKADGDAAKAEPLTVIARAFARIPCRRFFAEEVGRELTTATATRSSTGRPCRCAPTLDPKMQLMARKRSPTARALRPRPTLSRSGQADRHRLELGPGASGRFSALGDVAPCLRSP